MRYALAPRILALSQGVSAEDRLVEAANTLLFDKTREIGWPLALATPLGERMSVRVTTDTVTSLGLHKRHVGSEIAMAEASGGVVHLAFLEPSEREAKIALLAEATSPIQPVARNREKLDSLIAAAERDGYSVDPVRGPERALSVPVFEEGRIRAVLVMMYMASAISRDRLAASFVPQMKALAAALERAAFTQTREMRSDGVAEPDPLAPPA